MPLLVDQRKNRPGHDKPRKYGNAMLNQLVEHEGYRINPYVDTEGYTTGGIGHKFTEEDYLQWDPQWSDKEKEKFWTEKFHQDYQKASRQSVALMLEHGITPGKKERALLTDMVFNLGYEGAKKFDKMLKALSDVKKDKKDKEKHKAKAIKEMKRNEADDGPSKWYTQVPERVDALAAIVESM